MGLALYHALDGRFTAKLDRTIMAGNLQLDEENTTESTQVQIVERITQVVAKDSATDLVIRQIKMMQQVSACKREPNEQPSVFAHQFQGWDFSYINYISSSNSPQNHRGLAMVILQNANLSSAVYHAFITQLIAKAKRTG